MLRIWYSRFTAPKIRILQAYMKEVHLFLLLAWQQGAECTAMASTSCLALSRLYHAPAVTLY